MISTIILALPFLIIATAAFYLRRKSYLLSSVVVSLGLSSWVAIFYFIRLQGATFGGADFGFAFILMYSPMAVIPMALFGLYLGSSVSLAKAFEISFIAVFAWILLSLGYNHLIYIQKEEYEEKEEIDCDTMPYHCAISQGRRSDLPQLKKQGADIDSVDKSGRTALQRFIFLPEVVDTLLQLEANPNAKDWTGSTPLSTALVQTVAVDLELASSCPLMRDSRIAELAKRLRTISKITSPGKKNDSAPQNEPYLRPQGPRFVERTAIL